MKTLAIHPNEWRELCETFTQLNKGTVIDLEFVRFDGRRDQVARGDVFQKMTFDMSDACNNMITIVVGTEGQRRVSHEVIEPIHLRLKGNEEGRKYLQIEAENGVTLLDFHSGRFPLEKYESEFAGLGKERERTLETGVPIPS